MNGADGLQRRHTGAGHRQSGTNGDAESVLAQLGGWFDDPTASRRVRHSACEDPAEDRARDAGTSQR